MSVGDSLAVLGSVLLICATVIGIVRWAFDERLKGTEVKIELLESQIKDLDKAMTQRFTDLKELLEVRFNHVEKAIQEHRHE